MMDCIIWEVEHQLELLFVPRDLSKIIRLEPGLNAYLDRNLRPIRPEDLDEIIETENEKELV